MANSDVLHKMSRQFRERKYKIIDYKLQLDYSKNTTTKYKVVFTILKGICTFFT